MNIKLNFFFFQNPQPLVQPFTTQSTKWHAVDLPRTKQAILDKLTL